MGLTERHWFENEDVPENYEWALEDAVYNSHTNLTEMPDRDAAELLKEQEAKCLTKAELDDLNENQFVWIEGRATDYFYCLQIIGICRGKTGVSDIQFNAPTSFVEKSTNRYGKSYRIWTNKPTKEQRQAVKWE